MQARPRRLWSRWRLCASSPVVSDSPEFAFTEGQSLIRPAFPSLEVQGVADKIRVLMSFDEMAFDIKRLNFKTVAFQGLFEPKKLISYAQHAQHVDSNKTKSQAPPATPKRPKSTGPGPHPHPPGTSRKDDRKENGAPLKPGSRSIDPKKVRGASVSFDGSAADVSHLRSRSPSKHHLLATLISSRCELDSTSTHSQRLTSTRARLRRNRNARDLRALTRTSTL